MTTLPKPPFLFIDTKDRLILCICIRPRKERRYYGLDIFDSSHAHTKDQIKEVLSPEDPRIPPEMKALYDELAEAKGWQPLENPSVLTATHKFKIEDTVKIIGDGNFEGEIATIVEIGTIVKIDNGIIPYRVKLHATDRLLWFHEKQLKKLEPAGPKVEEPTSSKTETVEKQFTTHKFPAVEVLEITKHGYLAVVTEDRDAIGSGETLLDAVCEAWEAHAALLAFREAKGIKPTTPKTEQVADRISKNDAMVGIAKDLFIRNASDFTALQAVKLAKELVDAFEAEGCFGKGESHE